MLSLAKRIVSSPPHGVQASPIAFGSVPRLRILSSPAWSRRPQMDSQQREWLLSPAQQVATKHFV